LTGFQKKNTQISYFIRTCPVRTQLFHAKRQADGQIDRHDKANSHFSKFCEHAYKQW